MFDNAASIPGIFADEYRDSISTVYSSTTLTTDYHRLDNLVETYELAFGATPFYTTSGLFETTDEPFEAYYFDDGSLQRYHYTLGGEINNARITGGMFDDNPVVPGIFADEARDLVTTAYGSLQIEK